ncbi:MAG: hypothetical protein K9J85_02680 [Desulfobacteraceae bacterium]|nr:hypothetical protein [Desulfobacteraceae bacterium]
MRDPSGGPNPARIIIVVVALVLLAVLGYFGWHRFMQWHEQEVRTAVDREKQKIEQQREEPGEDIFKSRKPKQPDKEKPEQEISGRRLEEVFGEPVFRDQDIDCAVLEQQIKSFFEYLEKSKGIGSGEKGAYEIFEEMINDLAMTPPLVSEETRNLSNLLKNRAHFFRVLGKERIKLVLAVLGFDTEVLEHAMDNFYNYFVAENCCEDYSGSCISDETLYEFAAFFLDTLSGQSYLMRRDAPIRALVYYYSVLVLDRAIEKGINSYGIDIRPRIEDAAGEIRDRNDLRFQRRYLETLDELREKYGGAPAD